MHWSWGLSYSYINIVTFCSNGRYIEYMYYGFDGDESGVIEIEPKSAAYEFSEQILLGYMKYSYFDLEKQIL